MAKFGSRDARLPNSLSDGITNLPPARPVTGPHECAADIKPPVEIPAAGMGWLGAARTGGHGARVLGVRYGRAPAQAAVVPVIPPTSGEAEAARGPALIGQPREFCIVVSDTIRGIWRSGSIPCAGAHHRDSL